MQNKKLFYRAGYIFSVVISFDVRGVACPTTSLAEWRECAKQARAQGLRVDTRPPFSEDEEPLGFAALSHRRRRLHGSTPNKISLTDENNQNKYNNIKHDIAKQIDCPHCMFDFSMMEPKRAPQNIGLNFTGMTYQNSPSNTLFPPDSQGDVGPTQYIVAINNGLRSFNKSDGTFDGVLDVSLASFMGSSDPNVFAADPRIRYDRRTDRWFITSGIIPTFATVRIAIVISDSGIITKNTKWTRFSFIHDQIPPAGDTGQGADFPTLAVTENAVIIGVNYFDIMTGQFLSSSIFVFQKQSLLSGGPVIATAFRNLLGSTLQPVDDFDNGSPFDYVLGTDDIENLPTGTNLIMYRISGSGTATPTISPPTLIPVLLYANSIPAPHKGNLLEPLERLDAINARLNEVHKSNNQMYAIHSLAVNNLGVSSVAGDRDGLRWYQIDVTNPLVPIIVQTGTFFDSAAINPRFFYIPAIMTNVNADMAIACTTSSLTEYADALAVGRLSSDASGTLQAPVLLTNSQSSFNLFLPTDNPPGEWQRWGDYSRISRDVDGLTMWSIEEFTASPDNYGVQVTELLAPAS